MCVARRLLRNALNVFQLYPFIKIVVQLHKKIMSDHLAAKADGALSIAHLAILQPLSTQVLTRFEDLVAALYGPQDVATINIAFSAMLETTASLKRSLVPSVDEDLANAVDKLHLSGSSQPVESKTNKWFRLCFVQIDKMAQTIRLT